MTAAEKRAAELAAQKLPTPSPEAEAALQELAPTLPADKELTETGKLYLANELEEANRPIISVLSTDNPLPNLVGPAPTPKQEAAAEPLSLEEQTKQLLKQHGLKRAIVEKATDVVTFDESLIARLLEKNTSAYTEIKA